MSRAAAGLFGLAALWGIGSLVLVLVPSAAGQVGTVQMIATYRATGDWQSDGFLDAATETATWAVDVGIEASPTAACADDPELTMEVGDPSGALAGSVAPSSQRVHFPPGGGTLHAHANLTLRLRAEVPALEEREAVVRVALHKCSSPAGTTPDAAVNATVAATAAFRPGLEVGFDTTSSYDGVFPYRLRNTGNGPLRVEVGVDQPPGANATPALLPATTVEPGAGAGGVLSLAARVPGNYTARFLGAYAEEASGPLPTVSYAQALELRAPPPVDRARSPGPAWFVAVGVAAVVAARRRA